MWRKLRCRPITWLLRARVARLSRLSFLLAALFFVPNSSLAQTSSQAPSSALSYRYGDRDPVTWDGRPPSSYPVHGLDVSRFQGQIDWQKVRRAGIEFAFLKATEGGDLLDPRFSENWREARRAGIARGAYHFYYFCTPPDVQARWFIRNVPRQNTALPPVLDLEWNPFSPTCTRRTPGAEVRRQARIFMDLVEAHYGKRPIIYTTVEFYRQTDLGQLREEFWLRSTAQTPDKTYPGQSWSFWQYTGTGLMPGVSGDVDINVFGGSRAHWQRWRDAPIASKKAAQTRKADPQAAR
ncbi:MAG: GH25 family lysozyme [Pseudomonadota bacterium]